MFPNYLRVICALVSLASLLLCLKFSNQGFEEILRFKQLERVVETDIIGSTNGPVLLSGIVRAGKTVNSPSAGIPSVYYRYRLEIEETDSDGNASWKTKEEYQRANDFIIEDSSGKALVLASNYLDQINWQVQQSYQNTIGRYRYTEWRLESGQSISAFGRAKLKNEPDDRPEIELHFEQQDFTDAIVTNRSMSDVRADMGGSANLQLWAGISLLGLAILLIVFVFKIHRILAFLSILALSSFVFLSMSGFKMLVSDITKGSQFVEKQSQALQAAIDSLADANYTPENSDAMPNWVSDRLSALSVNLLYLERNFARQNHGFPENIAIKLMSIKPPNSTLKLGQPEAQLLQERLATNNTTRLSAFMKWALVASVIVFFITAWFAIKSAKVKRLIENVTTTLSSGLSYGIAELKGELTLIKQTELRSPLTNTPCAWYRYLVEEKKGNGKNSRWVTVQDDTRCVNFAAKDKEGNVPINAKDAEVITRHKTTSSRGRTRYSQWLLKPSDELYIIGQAEPDLDRAELVINKGNPDDVFIISNYSESDVMLKKALLSMIAFYAAFSALFFSVITWRGMEGQFSATDYMAAGLIAPLFLAVLMLIMHYNDIIFLKTRAQRNWANIQVSLKKRFDLLPQLEKVLKSYTDHESELQQLLAAQRTMTDSALKTPTKLAPLISNEKILQKSFQALIEAYPELEADQLSSQLMDTLTQLENEVAFMRTGYNDSCTEYNARIQSFPDILLAKVFSFKTLDLIAR